MAVARVEWQCPGCERRFAIRADMETPELCPQCRAETGTKPGVPDAAGSELAGGLPDFAPEEPPRGVVPPQIQPASAVRPRKYPALKVLSIVYKVIAVLTAIGGVVALVMAVVGAFTIEDAALRVASIQFQLGAFAGSVFVAVTLYAFGELVQLLIDIESNTRAGR